MRIKRPCPHPLSKLKLLALVLGLLGESVSTGQDKCEPWWNVCRTGAGGGISLSSASGKARVVVVGGDKSTGTVVQNDGRTSGDSGADGDLRCDAGDFSDAGDRDVFGVLNVDVDGDFDVLVRVGVLNVVGGLMMTSSRLLLWSRRFFFCDASSASSVASAVPLLSASR